MKSAVRTFLSILYMVLLLMGANTGEAHSAAIPAIDALDKQRQTMPPAPSSLPRPLVVQDEQTPGIAPSVTFTLGTLSISGASVFSPEELLGPYTSLYGQRVSFGQIQTIAAEITKKYREAGYTLSRVVIPPQELDPQRATVRLIVIEGFVSSIKVEPASPDDASFIPAVLRRTEGMREKILATKPFRQAAFEREMLLLQDIPGLKIASRFEPSKDVHGGTDLILTAGRKALELRLGGGNTGTKSAGPVMVSVDASVSTFPLGAKTTISYGQAEPAWEYNYWQANQSYMLPSGLSFYASYGQSYSPSPDTDFARLFNYQTQSQYGSFGASYPFIRTRDMNLSMALDMNFRNSQGDLAGQRFTRDRLRSLSGSINFDIADEWGGVSQAILTYTQGLPWFDATDKTRDSSNPLAPAIFSKWSLYLSRNQQLPQGFSVFLAAQGQVSDNYLSSYNQYSLGGLQFGRGYDPGVINGDRGFGASAELRWTKFLVDGVSLQPFTFVDYGLADLYQTTSLGQWSSMQHLASWGAGLRLYAIGEGYVPDFNISMFLAKPLRDIPGVETNSSRFVLQASMTF